MCIRISAEILETIKAEKLGISMQQSSTATNSYAKIQFLTETYLFYQYKLYALKNDC